MKPRTIYTKTMPFVWAKLLLGLATVAISIAMFAILMGIAWLINSEGVTMFMVVIWICATGVARFVLMRYVGYLVKAGHVAVITEAVTTGRVPDNQVAYGKQMVKERFLTSNVYFLVDRLVAGAVRQLQRVLEKAGNLFSFVPGMKTIVSIGKMFIGIALGYVDECCLGYTFYMKDQGAFKSAADGVAIYFQNWKKLLKDAAKTTATVVALTAIAVLASFLVFGLLFRLLGWNLLVAFLVACFAAWAVKFSFIDSYMMVTMMVSYMEEAPSTAITFDLYGKLCGMSAKFKQLWGKAQEESPQSTQSPQSPQSAPGAQPPAYASAAASAAASATASAAAYGGASNGSGEEKSRYCGNCGSMNKGSSKFCGSCGRPM